ncbi:MAG: glycosyltransferase family 1 protein [Chloroflexia bacterium]|nr:glycosyltransferase family 1 protein [Chloroflexia bacterium]
MQGPMEIVARLLRHSIGRMTLRSAACLLFTSKDYGYASHSRPLVHASSVCIRELPNGVDVNTFAPGSGVALRQRLGVGTAQPLVLLVGGLDRAHYFKGVSILLHALAALPSSVQAMIVGDGDLRSDYEATAAQLGLAERVAFVGRVSDAELPEYYRAADVTVLPSTTMGEAFGLVLIESLACATPVVASNLPGVRTVVEHGNDGVLVPPGDVTALTTALDVLLGNPGQRKAMGRCGRAKVLARYAWPIIGTRLEQIYAEVLGQSLTVLEQGL